MQNDQSKAKNDEATTKTKFKHAQEIKKMAAISAYFNAGKAISML